VWLTVHHSSMWNKKPTRYHLVLYLFLLYKLLNMFRATLCPSSGTDDLVVFFAACGVVPWLCRLSDPVGWLCVHWEVRSTTCYVLPNGHTTSQPDLTAYTATELHHKWKNTTKSSAPEDGHKVAGWLCVHWEVRSMLCYVLPNGHTTSQPDLTAYTATALHHTWKKYH